MQPCVHEYHANIITELVRVRSALHPILVTALKTLSGCVCARMRTCVHIPTNMGISGCLHTYMVYLYWRRDVLEGGKWNCIGNASFQPSLVTWSLLISLSLITVLSHTKPQTARSSWPSPQYSPSSSREAYALIPNSHKCPSREIF